MEPEKYLCAYDYNFGKRMLMQYGLCSEEEAEKLVNEYAKKAYDFAKSNIKRKEESDEVSMLKIANAFYDVYLVQSLPDTFKENVPVRAIARELKDAVSEEFLMKNASKRLKASKYMDDWSIWLRLKRLTDEFYPKLINLEALALNYQNIDTDDVYKYTKTYAEFSPFAMEKCMEYFGPAVKDHLDHLINERRFKIKNTDIAKIACNGGFWRGYIEHPNNNFFVKGEAIKHAKEAALIPFLNPDVNIALKNKLKENPELVWENIKNSIIEYYNDPAHQDNKYSWRLKKEIETEKDKDRHFELGSHDIYGNHR